ncbi:MAG: hypothetical protein ONB23_07945 [candidate division KSB1 bacterium]|nr:hypothetical protein [candidate division KSB1 bacterium]
MERSTGACHVCARVGEIIATVDQSYAGWDVEIGDAEDDGRNEIVLATGKGDRRKPGISYMLLLRKIP